MSSIYQNQRKTQAAKSPGAGAAPALRVEDGLPSNVVNAATAQALARAVVQWWRALDARGLLNRDEPLDVLDLAPGPDGACAWLLLQSLERAAKEAGLNDLHWRILPWQRNRQSFRDWLVLPEWKSAQDSGRMRALLWSAEKEDPCVLDPAGRHPWQSANPVAMIGQDLWAAGSQRLLAAHYGKLLEAPLSQLAGCDGDDGKLWQAVDPGSMDEVLTRTARAFLPGFNSLPLVWPTDSMDAVQRLARKAKTCLLLVSGEGDASEAALRLRGFAQVLQGWREKGRVPANFVLCQRYLEGLGARTMGSVASAHEHCIQALLFGDDAVASATPAGLLANRDWQNYPGLLRASRVMANSGQRMPLDGTLAMLECVQGDERVFSGAFPALVPAFQQQGLTDREGWSAMLDRVWRQHLPRSGSLLHREIAAVAMRIARWGFARDVLSRGMSQCGRNASDLAYLAWCDMRTGMLASARRLLAEALALNPRDRIALEVQSRLEQRARPAADEWQVSIAHPSLPIVLEPLDSSHAEALFYQYRDPQIAVMTGLQTLNTLEETRRWIVEHPDEKGRKPWAVMHRDHGLIGYVCLSNSAPSTYFCFWIGVDFQGQGWSGAAAQLCCSYARSRGMTGIFTSIYDDNTRSIRSLTRVGFKPMALRALPPDDDRRFYYWCEPEVSEEEAAAELIDYHLREKLPLKFPGVDPVPALAESQANA